MVNNCFHIQAMCSSSSAASTATVRRRRRRVRRRRCRPAACTSRAWGETPLPPRKRLRFFFSSLLLLADPLHGEGELRHHGGDRGPGLGRADARMPIPDADATLISSIDLGGTRRVPSAADSIVTWRPGATRRTPCSRAHPSRPTR